MSKSAAARVLVAGPDGVGKSTITSGACAALASGGLRIRHLHFDVRARDPKAQRDHTDPHGQVPRRVVGQFLSVMNRLRWYLGAVLGGALRRTGADLIVQERGWIDQQVDPRRYRLTDFGAQVAKHAAVMTPKMDMHILVRCAPSIAAARKRELSVEEIERQLGALERLGSSWQVVDTGIQDQEHSIAAMLRALRAARERRVLHSMRPIVGPPRRLAMSGSVGGGVAWRALYRPYSAAGRVARRLAWRRPWARGDGVVSRRVARVVSALDISWDALGAIRSHGRDQCVFAVQRGGTVHEFVRVQWGAVRSIVREAEVLRRADAMSGVSVPQVIFAGEVEDMAVLRMTALRGSDSPPDASLETALDVAVELARAGIVHGDFTAWNLLGGPLPGLVDWESSSLEFQPGVDLERFLATTPVAVDSETKADMMSVYLRRCAEARAELSAGPRKSGAD